MAEFNPNLARVTPDTYSNCLFYAIKKRLSLPGSRLSFVWVGRIPHFYVVAADGTRHQFTSVKPSKGLYPLWFKGYGATGVGAGKRAEAAPLAYTTYVQRPLPNPFENVHWVQDEIGTWKQVEKDVGPWVQDGNGNWTLAEEKLTAAQVDALTAWTLAKEAKQ